MKYKIIIYEPGKVEGAFYDYECGLETMNLMYFPSITEVSSEELGQNLYEMIKYGFRDNQHIRIEYNTDTSAQHLSSKNMVKRQSRLYSNIQSVG